MFYFFHMNTFLLSTMRFSDSRLSAASCSDRTLKYASSLIPYAITDNTNNITHDASTQIHWYFLITTKTVPYSSAQE